jgi:hypothetical protein
MKLGQALSTIGNLFYEVRNTIHKEDDAEPIKVVIPPTNTNILNAIIHVDIDE